MFALLYDTVTRNSNIQMITQCSVVMRLRLCPADGGRQTPAGLSRDLGVSWAAVMAGERSTGAQRGSGVATRHS